jgi:nucleotide-binding universal stress UspA family protein
MSTATRTLDLHLASILIATDFSHASEKPLNHALAIARRFGAHFYVAHIVSALGFAMAGPEATCAAEDAVCHDASQLQPQGHSKASRITSSSETAAFGKKSSA